MTTSSGTRWEVIPAIDLRGGRCVRLYQGDYARETVYSDDPAAMARQWAALGAPRLHVVDLDGARAGEPVNLDAIRAILAAVRVPVQVGGGVRTAATVARLLGLGVQRVVLGTAAVQDPDLTAAVCARYGDAVIIGVDARDGLVAVSGWTETASLKATDLIPRMEAAGARRFIYTDIGRDGTLAGPNLEQLREVAACCTSAKVVASGGVARLEDIAAVRALGVEGVIVGKALYDGAVDLGAALAVTDH
jgi:phosphoribosylformimino-5-aminoimidazole carboxamide ribotide isomerase